MAELISHDPAFAAKLLSLANSGFYARIQHQVTSLTQGVTLLGREAVAVLAFSFSLYRNLRGEEFGRFDHQRFWRRSIMASLAGRAVAKHGSYDNYEEVFLGALLQDIGMLALSVVSPDIYPQLVKDAAHCHHRLQELELQQYGSEHAEVGAWLAKEWSLPLVFQEPIAASHHIDEFDVSDEHQQIAKYVAVSGPIADIWCGSDTNQAVKEVVSLTQTLFNEGGEIVEPILTEIAESIPMISSLFEIDLGDPVEIQHSLRKAKEALLDTSGVEC